MWKFSCVNDSQPKTSVICLATENTFETFSATQCRSIPLTANGTNLHRQTSYEMSRLCVKRNKTNHSKGYCPRGSCGSAEGEGEREGGAAIYYKARIDSLIAATVSDHIWAQRGVNDSVWWSAIRLYRTRAICHDWHSTQLTAAQQETKHHLIPVKHYCYSSNSMYTVSQKKSDDMFLSYLLENWIDSDIIWHTVFWINLQQNTVNIFLLT